jgi:hypothetical protein
MTTATGAQVFAPSAMLQFARDMEALQRVVHQQFAPITKAIAETQKATTGLANAGMGLQRYAQTLTRAHVFLVEQYEKSPRAKQKKAHAHLVAICRQVLDKLRTRVSLREVAATHTSDTPQDTRQVLRCLLSEQHLANAPNAVRHFSTRTHRQVLATN